MDGAPLALAIANSVAGTDRLGSPGALGAWLEKNRPDGRAPSEGVLLRLGDFRALRDAVIAALERAVVRSPLPPEAVRALNRASAMAPAWPVLVLDGIGPAAVGTETSDTSETTRILASIARSAIELLGGPDAARLRRCPACGRFFLTSRSGQVWCSGACGNRTRVARHRARRSDPTEI